MANREQLLRKSQLDVKRQRHKFLSVGYWKPAWSIVFHAGFFAYSKFHFLEGVLVISSAPNIEVAFILKQLMLSIQ